MAATGLTECLKAITPSKTDKILSTHIVTTADLDFWQRKSRSAADNSEYEFHTL